MVRFVFNFGGSGHIDVYKNRDYTRKQTMLSGYGPQAYDINIGEIYQINAFPDSGYVFDKTCSQKMGCATINPFEGTATEDDNWNINFVLTPAPCTSNWQCELPLNTYESDGCGNRRINLARCNPCNNPSIIFIVS